MGNVLQFNPKKTIYCLTECAGCHSALGEHTAYTEVVMKHEDRNEHIALCPKCAAEASKYGVL